MELQAEQIENYSRVLNAFSNKLNTEIPEKLQPIMSVYLKSSHEAGCDQSARDDAVMLFSAEVHAILSDGLKDYLTIQSEIFSLKIKVTEELAEVLTKLEKQYDDSFQLSRQFLKDFIDNASDQEQVAVYNETVRQKGIETEVILSELTDQMQKESLQNQSGITKLCSNAASQKAM